MKWENMGLAFTLATMAYAIGIMAAAAFAPLWLLNHAGTVTASAPIVLLGLLAPIVGERLDRKGLGR